MEPFVAGLAIAVLVGWLLIIASVFQFVAPFGAGGTWRLLVQVLPGILYVVGGVYFRKWVSFRLPDSSGLGGELVFTIGLKPQIATYLK